MYFVKRVNLQLKLAKKIVMLAIPDITVAKLAVLHAPSVPVAITPLERTPHLLNASNASRASSKLTAPLPLAYHVLPVDTILWKV